MKIYYTSLFVFLLLFSSIARAAAPTTASTNLTYSSIEGNSMTLGWTIGNGAKRIIIGRKDSPVTAVPANGVDYIANATFGLGNEVSAGQFVLYDNTGSLSAITGLLPGSTYYFAVFEYNGSGFTTEYLLAPFLAGTKATLVAPTTQPSGISFSLVTGNSMKISWTAGNGTGRLVLIRAGSAVNANPDDLVSYTSSTGYGSGDQVGTGNYVIQKGNATSVSVTNLQPSTVYHVAIIEYNGNNGPVYMTSSIPVAALSTAARPTTVPSNIIFSAIEGNSINLNWTNGNGSRRIIVAKAGSAVTAVPADGVSYTANNNFGSGTEILPGEFVVYDGNSTIASLRALQYGNTYHVAIFEYDGSGATSAYMTTGLTGNRATLTMPTTQASALSFTNIGSSSVTLNWLNGNGTNRIVLAKVGAAVDAAPVNYTSYNQFAAFGTGSQIGTGNYVVYKGSGSSVTVTNLGFNTTYHFAVYELNGSAGPVYYTVSPATGNMMTNSKPTTASSAVVATNTEGNSSTFSWTPGNGANRIVIMRAGAAVTAIPTDGTAYSASNVFGNGDQLSAGQYVVYNGPGSSFNASNLLPGTTYYLSVFEYNGAAATTSYLTASYGSGNATTIAAPTVQSGNISFANITGNSMQVNWTNGNGAKTIVLVRQDNAVNALPVNFSTYTNSASFGLGSNLGNAVYVLYAGAGSSVNLIGLQPNTTYHFAAISFNGTNGPVYLTSPLSTASQATAPRPTAASTAISFTNVDGNSLSTSWVNGNGTKRIVIAKAGSAVTATPVDGLTYTASASFGTGDQLAAGEYVVMNSANNNVPLQNLQPNTTYYFAVFEYDGTASATSYMSTALTGNRSTLSAPTIAATSAQFTTVTNASMTVNWTNGNGAQRMVIVHKDSPVTAVPSNLGSYTASPVYANGTNLGNNCYVVYKGNASSVTLTGLVSGTSYYVSVYEFNGSSGPIFLLTDPATGSGTTIGLPQVQATTVNAASPTGNTVQLNWTNGSGQKRIVFAKKAMAVDVTPVDNVAYTANSFFGSGQQVGTGNYVVFNGTGNSATITNLEPQTVYHFAIFEYNDFGATKMYLTTNPARTNSVTAVLPVVFINFGATLRANDIELEWATASEINADRYDIERSSDGTRFSVVGSVAAAGNSSTRNNYKYVDANNTTGTWFYRLRQVDQDGKSVYTRVVVVNRTTTATIKILGNPVQNQLNLSISALQGKTIARIIEMSGRIMQERQLTSAGTTSIDVSKLSAGVYMLQLISEGKVEKLQFIKQ
jgi:hypothetical protein